MFFTAHRRRIARSIVALIALGFLQTTTSAPASAIEQLAAPTISSITATSNSITVNLQTAGVTAASWRYILTRQQVSGCSTSLTDGAVNTTGSLVAAITITGLTSGCTYTVRVAAFNGVVGIYASQDKLVGIYTNGLLAYTKPESGASTSMTRVPFTTSTCDTRTVTNLDINYGTTGPGSCASDGFTTYYVGYIKAPYTGTVTFKNSSDDGFYLNIQGQNVISYNSDVAASLYNSSGTISMVADEIYRIEAWHHENATNASVKLYWDYSTFGTLIVPSSALATDPSVFAGTCPLGSTSRCAAGSALEIKRATGTNMDGMYWILINGTPTLTYCIMNSSMKGGGWMLAMRGKSTGSTFGYTSDYWIDSRVLNDTYPERFKTGDTVRDVDAKYAVFNSTPANQIMALFPESDAQKGGGAIASTTTTGVNSDKYGFSWIETFTAGTAWDGSSKSTAYTDKYTIATTTNIGPTGTPTCVTNPSTLSYLFATASRCLVRRVTSTYSNTETPYSAVGDNLFVSQSDVRFFGFNYGSSNTGSRDRARWGFGWNENAGSVEDSNDVSSGIGLDRNGYSSITTGSINHCCTVAQAGISGTGQPSSRNLAFEMYVRNINEISVSGHAVVSMTKGRTGTLVSSRAYYPAGNTGTTTFRLSPIRDGIMIDSVTGVLSASEGLAVGSYTTTVVVGDSTGASGIKTVTLNILADSSETDTALTFSGSNYVEDNGTFATTGDFTYEMWVKPADSCSQDLGYNRALSAVNVFFSCRNGYWYFSFIDNSSVTYHMKLNKPVVANQWVHLAATRTSTVGRVYYNNTQAWETSTSMAKYAETFTISTIKNEFVSLKLGGTGTSNEYFTGDIDEVKVFQSARSQADIWRTAHVQEDRYIDSLLMYYDFNEASGGAIGRGHRGTYEFTLGTVTRTPVAQVSTSGPYTVVAVPRTIITSIGGWRAPDTVRALTALVLAGGGGGGGGYEGGGGGGGGAIESTVSVNPREVYPIRIGVGGVGASNPTPAANGEDSSGFGISATGGGSGGSEFNVSGANVQYAPSTGGSGGGGLWGSYLTGASGTNGQGFAGGNSTNLSGCGNYAGAGGGGAAGAGESPTCTKGGNGGLGKVSLVTGTYVGAGGGGSARIATSSSWQGLANTALSSVGGNSGYTSAALIGATGGASHGAAGTGTGGGAGLDVNGYTGFGGAGGSGTVTFRYLTNTRPTYTAPTNTTLNAGMTETFSVNVAADSQTAMMTRTFRWESSTTTETGTYSLIKTGTGAANASFSWIPQDTATSGSQFVYRVIVTDSDTAGLWYQDTSTAVFAVINGRLTLTSKSTLTKTVNISKTETFTVSSGTPTYSYSLSPTSTNFWLDTSTVGSPRIKFSDTVTVGTYYETFTVTDSVSASIVVPLTIVVSPPPNFGANSGMVDSGTVLYLDAGISTSYSGSGTTWTDLSGRANNANLNYGFGTSATYADGSTRTNGITSNTNLTCTSPTFNPASMGSFDISTVGQCIYAPKVLPSPETTTPIYTLQTWVKRNGTQTAWNNIICNPFRNSGDYIEICLFWIGASTVNAGIYNGGTALWYLTSSYSMPDQTWTNISVTYNGGTGLNMYINDSTTAYSASVTSFVWNPAKVDPGLLMGRKWDATSTMNGSIGMVRLYNRILTASEIAQNYNATKGRFLQTQNKIAPTGKYGTTVNETYTVTAGSETITASFTSSAIAGLIWDTSTVRSMKVQLQESLTAGTYYDTITVTDFYGSSSRIPIAFKIAKADTLTVYIDTPTALNYTGSPATFVTPLRVTGLVSSDTGTAVSSITYRPGGTSCATGGACSIGDIGPGGGIVFITPATASGNGKYFEAAPANWAGLDDTMSIGKFCTASTSQDGISRGASQYGIGWGDTNTALFEPNCTGGAVRLAADYAGGGYTDWFIPDTNEATQLYTYGDLVGLIKLGSNWTTGNWGYWASTENAGTQMKTIQNNGGTWGIGAAEKSDSTHLMVRPVRMFTPCWAVDSCTAVASTTKPTDAGTYAISPAGLSLTSGDLNNYIAIKYETTTVTINRINQTALQLPYYNPTFPETMTVYTGGGSGSGVVTYTVNVGGTASGCAFDYRKLYTTSVGTCNIQVVKAADRNYLAETATAYIYFIQFVINQPSPGAGSGPNIALTGATSVTLDPNQAPIITGVGYQNACNPMGCTDYWEIRGAGFGAPNNTDIIVKFWRNKVLTLGSFGSTAYVLNDALIIFSAYPVGATTGKITVTNANGIAVSPEFFVIP